ncbi:lipopolysaccharide transport periplasmic protein LptA [Shewanella putrefaciens]|uniref:lipopolysaccharide transport periplasmic protein LptA n=1 Tax=Shewanella TaxID=22 RepID=UPI00200329C9|nr:MULTISPECIES: lipopolysaccharide transport periplasmic protein LptA [Shewanella]MCA1897876.1 lipopolysaccharide transport periplasmic protein LptA [Shewanella putrefaciens]MCK7628927.1 lipopolysaccharide transport periplasmic protein LptA [Shewanella sp. JNE9-1]MCK7633417.1 lipopolysaccharide transport periplasmic protein LptA [Shewanella sp. JNE17]MCK7644176.1 lipopolysaccharide transport periplasmic protein LptA [Shewanella sp. JNE3-1]MCK7648824.1 lipopolysaccharide transport periplasmic 
MKQNKILLASLMLIMSMSVYAKVADLQQEVKIKAVSQTADIKNNQIIFFGPVEVTQGSIKIQAAQLRAFSADGETSKILVATGNPATYTQILDDGRPASASAKEIRYEMATRTLTLTGSASLDQAGSQVTGNLIRYNIIQQKLIAESTGSGDDRVITIIQPENYQDDLKTQTPADKPVKEQDSQ